MAASRRSTRSPVSDSSSASKRAKSARSTGADQHASECRSAAHAMAALGQLGRPCCQAERRYSLNEPTIVSVSRSGSDAPKADTRSYGLREDLSERSSCVDQWTELAFSGMLAVR